MGDVIELDAECQSVGMAICCIHGCRGWLGWVPEGGSHRQSAYGLKGWNGGLRWWWRVRGGGRGRGRCVGGLRKGGSVEGVSRDGLECKVVGWIADDS